MTAAHFQAPDAPGFRLDPRVIGAFARFAGGYWRDKNAIRAWTLTLGLAGACLLSTAATVALNQWNRWFFDALERRDVEVVTQAVFVFALIIAAMAASGLWLVLARQTLQVRWRAWIVEHLVDRWLGERRFYYLNVSGREPPNPEYRISDDTRWATEPLVDLGIGLLLALAGATAFISILWSVGGSIVVALGSWGTLKIPAYMVWVALAYGMLASGLMLWVGAPLVGYVGRKNEAEGYFRFAMMRIRDNAESVALMNGGRYEQAILGRFYDTVVARWLAIVWQHAHLTWITNAAGPMKPIVPLLFLAPKYLAGDLSLGQVTQLAAAFVEVQIAISWVVDNYNRVAEWYASARRVMDIVDACEMTDREALSANRPTHGPAIHVTDFEIADGRNRPLLSGTGFAAATGEAVHIYGESSTGKSTLVRVLAGLWPSARGVISVPDRADIMIAPQKTYLPLGSLRGALLYPSPALEVSDTRLASALEKVGLGGLVPRLGEVTRWDQVLSNGERQRLGIARLAIHAPRAVILDDALCALDEGTQAALFAHLRTELPNAIIVSLAQRPAAWHLNGRQLCLERNGESSILRAAGMPSMAVAQ